MRTLNPKQYFGDTIIGYAEDLLSKNYEVHLKDPPLTISLSKELFDGLTCRVHGVYLEYTVLDWAVLLNYAKHLKLDYEISTHYLEELQLMYRKHYPDVPPRKSGLIEPDLRVVYDFWEGRGWN